MFWSCCGGWDGPEIGVIGQGSLMVYKRRDRYSLGETPKFTTEGRCDDSPLKVYQMSLTSQLPLVANFSGKLVTTSLEF